MLPSQDLLHRIRWDAEFGSGRCTGHEDRGAALANHRDRISGTEVSRRRQGMWQDALGISAASARCVNRAAERRNGNATTLRAVRIFSMIGAGSAGGQGCAGAIKPGAWPQRLVEHALVLDLTMTRTQYYRDDCLNRPAGR